MAPYLQLSGYCAIDYSESSTTTPDPFALGAAVIGNVVSMKKLTL